MPLLALFLTLFQTGDASEALAGHVLVWSAREKAVLRVGGDAAGARPLHRLVVARWEALPGSELPSRSLAAVAADVEGNLLLHGGSVCVPKPDGGCDYRVSGETWGWDGKAWTCLATRGPAPRDHHGLAFDSRRKTFVLFGGSDADPSGRTVLFGDTWEWAGKQWELVAEEGPPPGAHLALAYDPVRERTILVGGRGDDRTWAWDGMEWKAIAQGPPANRSSPRLTWDPRGQRLLLFGGDSGRVYPGDTWAWDGTSWTMIANAGPPGRSVHALTFDVARGAAVLSGGFDGERIIDDLWEFTDERWKPLQR